MRCIVTGGAGFIGSHLCDALRECGHAVVCVDNLVTGARENIAQLDDDPGFTFLKQDISQPFVLDGPVDRILHFASPASPVDYARLPIETLRVGSVGTHQMLEVARKKGARILLASTSEVYGDPLEHPQKESYFGHVNSIGPRSCYDEAKRYAEAAVMAWRRVYALDTRIIRIFNTYGPRMRMADGRVIPNFLSQALTGADLTIYGDGKQTRSFCYVDDLVRGILALLEHDGFHEPVNLGNPVEHTILELVESVLSLTGTQEQLAWRPMPTDDPKRRRPDITRARELLGWEPKVALRDGLALTIEDFRRRGCA